MDAKLPKLTNAALYANWKKKVTEFILFAGTCGSWVGISPRGSGFSIPNTSHFIPCVLPAPAGYAALRYRIVGLKRFDDRVELIPL